MTVGCLNCDTKSVYSIRNKASGSSSSAALFSGQSDEFVVIHKDTIFGSQLDDVRNDDQFSDIFDIKLSNSASSISLTHSNEVPDKLRAQHQELYQVLEKALDKMRLASEVRIEQWKKVEMERLEEGSQRAREESKRLWQKVLSMNQPLPTQQASNKDGGSSTTKSATAVTTTDGIPHNIQPQPSSSSSSSSPSVRMTTPVTPAKVTVTPTSIDASTPSSSPSMADTQQESKRSQAVRFMDHSNDSVMSTLPSSYRRSSFSLNHSAIANSSQQGEVLTDHRLSNLANAPIDQDQKDAASSDEEDMFDLDEELDSNDDEDGKQQQGQHEPNAEETNDTDKEVTNIEESSNASDHSIKIKSKGITNDGSNGTYGSSWIKRKKLTGKYIDDNDGRLDKEEIHAATVNDGLEDLSTSISKYATSMPIDIHSAMANFVLPKDDNAVEPAEEDPTNVYDTNENPSNDDHHLLPLPSSRPPNVIASSYSFAPQKTATSSTSFIGYDFSFSDRALSKQFPDYNAERRKSVATIPGRHHRPQLDALIEKSSLDTRTAMKK
ncbi:hypothetical protein BCR42DRAFT_76090 [Absidia repens]|uniref:Uncharacterized protein n=1 Tax=Absidia repens TaxID=90262 RepID=A0A1X2IAE1_9FUNG|nr:hypothetical protein BCR42DRAFT_76090 [Absidia repens]